MMTSRRIHFREGGYDYKLAEDARFVLPKGMTILSTGRLPWCIQARNGYLIIKAGYAWDGISGPTFNTKSGRRGSLWHDILYQLMRLGLISISWRSTADDEYARVCLEDGMWRWRVWLHRRMLRKFAEKHAVPRARTWDVETAP